MKAISTETPFDKILANFLDPDAAPLTPALQEQLDRWNAADNFIRTRGKGEEYTDVIQMLMKKFGQSRATAYRDVLAAKKLFGSVSKEEKDYWRNVYAEWLHENIKNASADKDYEAVNSAIKILADIRGLKNFDPETIDWASLQPSTYVLQINMPGADPLLLDANKPWLLNPAARQQIIRSLEPNKMTEEEMIKLIQNHDSSTPNQAAQI